MRPLLRTLQTQRRTAPGATASHLADLGSTGLLSRTSSMSGDCGSPGSLSQATRRLPRSRWRGRRAVRLCSRRAGRTDRPPNTIFSASPPSSPRMSSKSGCRLPYTTQPHRTPTGLGVRDRSSSMDGLHGSHAEFPDMHGDSLWNQGDPENTDRRECARSPRPHVSLSVMARPGATHRTTAPSCTPATRDRACRPTARFTGVRPPAGTPACSMIPGWRPPPGPGAPGVRRHPGGSPAIPEPGPRARRHPGIQAGLPFTPRAVTLDQLHRKGDGPRAAGTTDGDASAPRQSRKTLLAA